MLIDAAVPGDRNVIKKVEDIKTRPHNTKSAHVEYESKSDTGNNRCDWNHFAVTQTIHEQRNRKARN